MYSIFKTFVLSLLMIAQVHFSYAQNAGILPPAKTTFVDQNGKPLTSGTVDFYTPSTSTRKTTWQDAAKTISNTNPVVLDSAGRALILGDGSYRQVVKDRLGNIVWDQVTSATGTGGSSVTGDGDAVGTIKPWAGLVPPSSQYVFTYGQTISRTTYADLLSVITFRSTITCVSGSPTITVSDTSSLAVGAALEAACVTGTSLIISKTPTTVTLNVNANVSTSVTGTFFPYGNGNGLTTFNVPDFRSYVMAGRTNMGGVVSPVLTAPFFSSNANNTPEALNAFGGIQGKVLLTANLPPQTPAGTITNGTVTVTGVKASTFTTTAVVAGGGNQGTYTDTSLITSQAASAFVGTAFAGQTSAPFSIIQPTVTVNFIIKILPDSSSSDVNGLNIGSTVINNGIPNAILYDNAGVLDNSPVGNTGNVPLYGSPLSDSGVIGTFVQPVSYLPVVTSGHRFCALDADCQYGNQYSQYPLGSVSNNPLLIGKAGNTIGSTTVGQTFKIVFTSSGLIGSPITITYTAGAAETITTIANGLCALVNANTTLHGVGGKPIFCQSLGSGVFNVQYDANFGATGATPLTTATTGSTGTINLVAEVNALDFIVMQLGRNVPGRFGRNGDALYSLDFTGQDSTGTFNTHYGQIGVTATIATAGATRGTIDFTTATNTGLQGRLAIKEGVVLKDNTGAIPIGGDLGPGTINVPVVGKYSIDNVNNIRRSSVSSQFIMETTNNDAIVLGSGTGGIGLQATPTGTTATSGLGFFVSGVQVPTTGQGISVTGGATPIITSRDYGGAANLPLRLAGTNVALGTAGTLTPLVFANATSGTITLQPVAGALGTPTLSLPAATDTLMGKATTDILTNKTYDTAGAGNSLSIAGVDVATAWAVYTPSASCGTATFTVNSARRKTLGKTTYIQLELTFTALGTCAVTNVTFNLPNTAQSGGALVGREINTNKGIDCIILASGTTANCLRTEATTWIAADHFVISGVYENQ